MNGPIALPLGRILPDRTLAYRDGLRFWAGAQGLRASIRRTGVLQPVTVTPDEGDRWRLVAGFRRVAVLEQLGAAEVLALPVTGPVPELFLRAVEEHCGQPPNLREVARALDVGRRLGWSLEQAACRLLPALALEPAVELARRYLELLELPPTLLSFLVDKGFSLRRALPLCRLTAQEASVVAKMLQNPGIRGGRQLEESTSQLVELAAREGRAVADVADELGLVGPPFDPDGPRRLQARRLPETTRRRSELDRLARELADSSIALSYDANFAGEEVELAIRVGSVDDLVQQTDRLARPETHWRLEAILELAGCKLPPQTSETSGRS